MTVTQIQHTQRWQNPVLWSKTGSSWGSCQPTPTCFLSEAGWSRLTELCKTSTPPTDVNKNKHADIVSFLFHSSAAPVLDVQRPHDAQINLKLQNILILLKRCCNHPYLVEYPLDPATQDFKVTPSSLMISVFTTTVIGVLWVFCFDLEEWVHSSSNTLKSEKNVFPHYGGWSRARAGVANSGPVGQFWPVTSFYMAHKSVQRW